MPAYSAFLDICEKSCASTDKFVCISWFLNDDRHGDLEATEDLLAVKKNVDQRDAEQRTPLHYAIAYNHPDVMQELLDAGADLTATVCLPLLLVLLTENDWQWGYLIFS